MKISRKRRIISLIIYILGLLALILSFIFDFNDNATSLCLAAALAGSLIEMPNCQCPHCRRFGVTAKNRRNPFAPDAGHCKYCGELIEYE